MRLPGRGVVLADPGLDIAELIEPAQDLEVPVMPGFEAPLRRVRGHGEIAEFHGVLRYGGFCRASGHARAGCGSGASLAAGRSRRRQSTTAPACRTTSAQKGISRRMKASNSSGEAEVV